MKNVVKIYISGAISSDPNWRFKFTEAERYISRFELPRCKFKIYNPLNWGREYKSWYWNMTVSLWYLLRSNKVYMLPGWTKSKGAKIEYKVARFLGKKFGKYKLTVKKNKTI